MLEELQVDGLRIERELGRGSFATVYQAYDNLVGRVVALKVIDPSAFGRAGVSTSEALREARVAGSLSSPHIVTLYGVRPLQDGRWVLEMEYVDGRSLEQELEQRGRLGTDEVLRVLRAVLRGLSVSHGRGFVHGDVKPANVLLGGDGCVKLTDFGLGALLRGDRDVQDGAGPPAGGTPLYAAPELLRGSAGTLAADLWSTGVMLYRMVSGRLPFPAVRLAELLALHVHPPPPLGAQVDPRLTDVVGRCLRWDPGARPGSPSAVLDLLERKRPLGISVRDGHPVERSRAPPPVGRDAESARVKDALARAEDGRGALVLVTGDVGVGTSGLLHEVGEQALDRAFLWAEARLAAAGGLYQPLRCCLRSLYRQAAGATELSKWISRARFGQAAKALRTLLDKALPPTRGRREQIVWALEQLVVALGTGQAIGIGLDDGQYCPADDLGLLHDLGRTLDDLPIVVALAYTTAGPRHDSSAPAHALVQRLEATPGVVHLALGPLPNDALMNLLCGESGGGSIAPEVLERVSRVSGGYPVHAVELFRELERTQQIVCGIGGVRRGPNWGWRELPQAFHALAAERLRGLTDPHREILDAAAVDGVDLVPEVLAAVLGRRLYDLLRDLQRLARGGGVLASRASCFAFAHPVFREVIYADVAPDLRRELHRRFAEELEARADHESAERTGVHWERAGVPERAAPHFRRAAIAAALRQESRRALDLAERAGLRPESLDTDTAARHADLLFALVGCQLDAGRGGEAEALADRMLALLVDAKELSLPLRARTWRERVAYRLHGAARVAVSQLTRAERALPDSADRARARLLLGRVCIDRGRLDEAVAWVESADDTARRLELLSVHAAALGALANIALHQGRARIAQELHDEAARIAGAEGWRQDAALHEVQGARAALGRGALGGLDATLLRALRTLESGGAADDVAITLSVLAQVRYAGGDAERALHTLAAAVRALGDDRDAPSLALVLPLYAYHLAIHGDLLAARATALEGCRVAERTGNYTREVLGASLQAHLATLEGNQGEARDLARRCLLMARRCANVRVRARVVLYLADSAVHGLSADVLSACDELLMDGIRAKDALCAIASDVLAGALSLTRPDGNPARLREAARACRRPEVGERHAELAAVAHLFDALAARREGALEASEAEMRLALDQAVRLRHVYLESTIRRLGS